MKILVVRFSSIGDIVLTSPVVRCIKKQLPRAEIHFLTKGAFQSILSENPYIDRIITIQKSIHEVLEELKSEKYDYLVDLHNNVRTRSLKMNLRVPNATFPKLHIEKWLLVNFKKQMNNQAHIVDRYFQAVAKLNVQNDQLPCDFFIAPSEIINVTTVGLEPKSYITFAIGAQFFTKRMPVSKMVEIVKQLKQPVVLLGGPMDFKNGEALVNALKDHQLFNFCGKYSLQQSASFVQQSAVLLTHDTGLMHIASAFEVPTVSVWGNTVPALGMYPYFPQSPEKFSIHERKEVRCRPCSKIGFQQCPKKHFDCMNLQDSTAIASDVNLKSMGN